MRPDGAAIPIPWREVWLWAAFGTVALTLVVLMHLQWSGGNPLGLIQPGLQGPAVDVFRADFPQSELASGVGHDGQQFYVIARSPNHLHEVADHLDRPRYRLQRPVYAWLAWALHPTGGGSGLVAAMLIVNIAAILLGGVSTGALSTLLRGPAWAAAMFALVPGSFAAMRISTADALAIAFVLAAFALSLRGHEPLAILAATAAVLTKEPMLLILLGWWLSNPQVKRVGIAAVPGVVAGAWWLFLRSTVPSEGGEIEEFVVPLTGLWRSARLWLEGSHLIAAAMVIVTVLVLLLFLARRPRTHPLWWPALASAALLPVMSLNVIGLSINATRVLTPALLLSLLGLLTPHAPALREERLPAAD